MVLLGSDIVKEFENVYILESLAMRVPDAGELARADCLMTARL